MIGSDGGGQEGGDEGMGDEGGGDNEGDASDSPVTGLVYPTERIRIRKQSRSPGKTRGCPRDNSSELFQELLSKIYLQLHR